MASAITAARGISRLMKAVLGGGRQSRRIRRVQRARRWSAEEWLGRTAMLSERSPAVSHRACLVKVRLYFRHRAGRELTTRCRFPAVAAVSFNPFVRSKPEWPLDTGRPADQEHTLKPVQSARPEGTPCEPEGARLLPGRDIRSTDSSQPREDARIELSLQR